MKRKRSFYLPIETALLLVKSTDRANMEPCGDVDWATIKARYDPYSREIILDVEWDLSPTRCSICNNPLIPGSDDLD